MGAAAAVSLKKVSRRWRLLFSCAVCNNFVRSDEYIKREQPSRADNFDRKLEHPSANYFLLPRDRQWAHAVLITHVDLGKVHSTAHGTM